MKKGMLLLALMIFGLAIIANAQEVCEGDLDCDGDIDSADLAIFAADYGRTNCQSGTRVITPCNCAEDALNIQQAINDLPSTGGTVFLRAGNYSLANGLHINRSNVTVLGEQGTNLKLDGHVNQPVILVGTDIESPTTIDIVNNIRIANMEIDGNKSNQDSEIDPQRVWIRNNGIDIRAVEKLWIENVNIHDARSGGLVTSWNSSTIFVSNASFHHNYFDGVALYDGNDIVVSSFLTFENIHGAGISIDNNLRQVFFNSGSVSNNGDVGIFGRDSEEIKFHNLTIAGNASHGVFLSHQSLSTNTGVKRYFFQGCSFFDNSGFGLWLASPASDSPNNTIIGCVFENNTAGCINLDPGATLAQASIICQ